MYIGDFVAGSTVDFKFTTLSTAGTGAPAAFSSGDLIVWKANSTAGSTAGITLSSTFASVVGLNHCRILTTGSTSFYVDGASYDVTISTGAVGSVSLVGYVIGRFSLTHRRPSSTEFPSGFQTAAMSTATWFPSTGAPTNFVQMVVSTSGIVDANVQQWRGTAPSTMAGGNMIKADISLSTGTVAAPPNFSSLAITAGGIVDADVETWRGTQPSTYRDWLDSTDAPTNWGQMSLTTAGRMSVGSFGSTALSDVKNQAIAALSSDVYDSPSTAPSSTGAPLSQQLGWMYALSRNTLMQNATEQTLLRQGSTAALATAILSATTSLVTRSTWA